MPSVLDEPRFRPMSGTRPRAGAPATVVWINGRQATVARCSSARHVTTRTIERGIESQLVYLGRVTHAIGECERVVILGPGTDRLALEREYVAVNHRPDRLVDVEPAGAMDVSELMSRARELAG